MIRKRFYSGSCFHLNCPNVLIPKRMVCTHINACHPPYISLLMHNSQEVRAISCPALTFVIYIVVVLLWECLRNSLLESPAFHFVGSTKISCTRFITDQNWLVMLLVEARKYIFNLKDKTPPYMLACCYSVLEWCLRVCAVGFNALQC